MPGIYNDGMNEGVPWTSRLISSGLCAALVLTSPAPGAYAVTAELAPGKIAAGRLDIRPDIRAVGLGDSGTPLQVSVPADLPESVIFRAPGPQVVLPLAEDALAVSAQTLPVVLPAVQNEAVFKQAEAVTAPRGRFAASTVRIRAGLRSALAFFSSRQAEPDLTPAAVSQEENLSGQNALVLNHQTLSPGVAKASPSRAQPRLPDRPAAVSKSAFIARACHAWSSVAYAGSLSLFAMYRHATALSRYGHYREIAIAVKQHHHVWTFWEKFDLGGLNDFLTIPTAMAMAYMSCLVYASIAKDENTQQPRPKKSHSMAFAAAFLTFSAELLFGITNQKTGMFRIDVMNILSYCLGGVCAMLAGYLLWWPRHEGNGPIHRNTTPLTIILVLLSFGGIAVHEACTSLAWSVGLSLGFWLFAAIFAVSLAAVFLRRKYLGL